MVRRSAKMFGSRWASVTVVLLFLKIRACEADDRNNAQMLMNENAKPQLTP